MILTLDLEPDLEMDLQKIANQEQSSPTEIAKKFIRYCLNQSQTKEIQTKQTLSSLTALTDDIDNHLNEHQKDLLERIKNIKRVTSPYSSEDMVRALREGKEHLLIDALANHAK